MGLSNPGGHLSARDKRGFSGSKAYLEYGKFKIDNILLEHCGLTHVLHLAVHL